MVKLHVIHIVICFVIFDKIDGGKTWNIKLVSFYMSLKMDQTDIKHNASFLINL